MRKTSAIDLRVTPPVSRRTAPVGSAMTTSPSPTIRTTVSSGGAKKPGPSMAASYASPPA
ncbi:hypothetical protein [Streptomyces sp. NPDC051109]|uniref:hypothetical protein n=1 Tax=Streptomyces sp. NPDC051109 TaxID=3365642 RepID=UPI003795BC8E